ncbi:MAG: Crp/Fnr family transcriptional regulator, partial [Pseudomonadota bacterium]
RQVINFVMPGDFMGLQAGLMKEMQHSAEAVTSMTLCVFDRKELWTLFKQSPELAYDLTWLAALEEHFLGTGLTALGQCSAEEKMAWALLRFFTRCQAVGLAKGDTCPFPYRQQDLADALGLSLVHTNKTLKKLSRQQILTVSDGHMRIADQERLHRLAVIEVEAPGTRPLI